MLPLDSLFNHGGFLSSGGLNGFGWLSTVLQVPQRLEVFRVVLASQAQSVLVVLFSLFGALLVVALGLFVEFGNPHRALNEMTESRPADRQHQEGHDARDDVPEPRRQLNLRVEEVPGVEVDAVGGVH